MSKTILVMVVVLSMLTFAPQLASADDAAPETKSRNTAFADSAIGTALSLGVLAQGVMSHDPTLAGAGLVGSLILPSAGEFYAGKLFTAGMGIRAASVGVGLLGVSAMGNCLWSTGRCGGGESLIALGAIGYVTGIVYDIAAAGSAVDDYNQRLQLRVTPAVIPTASSGPAVGLGIGGSF